MCFRSCRERKAPPFAAARGLMMALLEMNRAGNCWVRSRDSGRLSCQGWCGLATLSTGGAASLRQISLRATEPQVPSFRRMYTKGLRRGLLALSRVSHGPLALRIARSDPFRALLAVWLQFLGLLTAKSRRISCSCTSFQRSAS